MTSQLSDPVGHALHEWIEQLLDILLAEIDLHERLVNDSPEILQHLFELCLQGQAVWSQDISNTCLTT